ncbi:MAG: hypothetical protein KC423_19850 [Anaerolineales bacterium]|nr:hypothetical protein [Anaerolineales bacterium]
MNPLSQLIQHLDHHFSLDELRELTLTLDVEWENLSGDTRTVKSRELVELLNRNGRLPELIQLAQNHRPHLNWRDLPQFEQRISRYGVPMEKPPRAAHFTNREDDLAQLLADLQPGQVATLCGPGGIGKTALAAEAIWTLAPGTTPPQQFPDGILFHSFYGRPQIDLVLEKIVVAYGDEPKPNPLAAAQRVLGGRQALLLLDGAEEADNLPQLLQVRGGCGVLVTSRSRRDAAASRQDVAPLSIPHAVALLQKRGGKWAAEEAAATAICEQVGGWPLAVRLAGRYLQEAEETAAEYAAWLATTLLAALSLGTHQAENGEVLLERSVTQVDETARRLLGLVGQLALQPVAAAGLAAAVALPVSQLKQGWRQLLGYGLLQKRGDGYEATHPLIHTYASRRLEPAAEDFARLVAYYHELAQTESQKGLPGYRRLDGERAHIMRLLSGCVRREDWRQAIRLAWAVNDHLFIQGFVTELINASQFGLIASQKQGSQRGEESFLSWLGLAYRALGQVEKAICCLEEALAIFVAIKSPYAEMAQRQLDELKGKANA